MAKVAGAVVVNNNKVEVSDSVKKASARKTWRRAGAAFR